MNHFQPDDTLVATPPIKPREGLLGYVLRTSEANGYESPWQIFLKAGISQGQMTATTLPVSKLATILGRSEKELAALPWQIYPNGDPAPILNKGMPRLLRYLQLKKPKICPRCINENGIVDATWDLRIMQACPKHRQPLINQCPQCHRKIRWFRPGLCQCNCGHMFLNTETSFISDAAGDLLQVIYDTLHGMTTDPNPKSQIPVIDLNQLGPEHLLMFLGKLAHHILHRSRENRRRPIEYDISSIEQLAEVLSAWPTNFHHFLRSIDTNPTANSAGLARRFDLFYCSIVKAKTISKEKMLFVRQAVGEYAYHSGDYVVPDPRYFLPPEKWRQLHQQGLGNRQIHAQATSLGPIDFAKQAEVAKEIGIRAITLEKWAREGLFGIRAIPDRPRGRSIYKIPGQFPRKKPPEGISDREAGKFLGIPVSILERLRRDGFYQTTVIGRRRSQYARPDLDALRQSILEKAQKQITVLSDDHITLRNFFRMKLNGKENKYQVIRQILDNQIYPLGRLGEQIGDVVIGKKAIQSIRQDPTLQPTLPAYTVSRFLGCSPETIFTLAKQGRLTAIPRGRVLHITRESMHAFHEEYICSATIASALGSSAKHINGILETTEANVVKALYSRPSYQKTQYFCTRKDACQLFGREAIQLFEMPESSD